MRAVVRNAVPVAIAAVVATSLVLTVYGGAVRAPTSVPGISPPLGNGISFDAAYQAVNETVQNLSGGPWFPISIYGIATELPLAADPPSEMGPNGSFNQTMAACDPLPGVTAWNTTLLPVFTGGLASGAAPFWSMVFDNNTGSIAYVTDLEGTVNLYPPSPQLQSCATLTGLVGSSTVWIPSNTTELAEKAYSIAGSAFSQNNSPLVETYVLGASQSINTDFGGPSWIVNYWRCDLTGVAWVQNYTAVALSRSANTWAVDSGFITCTARGNHTILFGNPYRQNNAFDADFIPFQVELNTGNLTFDDASDVRTWMLDLTLLNSTGTQLPRAETTCPYWVTSIAYCQANSTGWFAVLLSASGEWEDSFPTNPNAQTWTYSNVGLYSHETLVIVAPQSWNETGDRLVVSSVPTLPAVSETSGSLTL